MARQRVICRCTRAYRASRLAFVVLCCALALSVRFSVARSSPLSDLLSEESKGALDAAVEAGNEAELENEAGAGARAGAISSSDNFQTGISVKAAAVKAATPASKTAVASKKTTSKTPVATKTQAAKTPAAKKTTAASKTPTASKSPVATKGSKTPASSKTPSTAKSTAAKTPTVASKKTPAGKATVPVTPKQPTKLKSTTPTTGTTTGSPRFQKLITALQNLGGYSRYISTAEVSGFGDYVGTLSGVKLTFFVTPDSAWQNIKVTQPRLLLQILKFQTFRGFYGKPALDALAVGSKFVTTDNFLRAIKAGDNLYKGQATDSAGACIQYGAAWYDKSSDGDWTVHVVSQLMVPPKLF